MRCDLAYVIGCLLAALPLEWYPAQDLSRTAFTGSMAMIGETIGHYRIVDRLGAGGMGVVYRAEDLALHRSVALKFLPAEFAADDEGRARFMREARMAAALNHPNTCTVYEVGEVDARPFIAMEFIEGETLAARVSRSGRLPIGETLEVAIQVAEGLAEAHSQHIVHRDLKPHNVMLTRGGRVKILDFGLATPLEKARPAGATITTSQLISADLGHPTVLGTCGYMSPEQALGKRVDQRSDVFAFGIMLYELVAGERPFRAETTTEVLAKIIEAEPAPLPQTGDIPAELTRITRRCLQKKPEARYHDTRNLVADLKDVRRRLTTTGARIASSVTITARRPWSTGMVATILFLFAAPLAYSVLWRSDAVPAQNSRKSRDIVLISPAPQPDETRKTPNNGVAKQTDTTRDPSKSSAAAPNPSPPRVGTLTLSSNPAATVALDGRVVGVSPLTIQAAPGTHELTMTTSDGLRWRGRIDVAVGQTASLHRDLNAVGTLAVVSEIWAEVSLDGGPPEQTPIQFSRVAAGLHDLRAFRDGYVPQRFEITVEESKTTTVRLTMERKQ